jgi:hypothetical protein
MYKTSYLDWVTYNNFIYRFEIFDLSSHVQDIIFRFELHIIILYMDLSHCTLKMKIYHNLSIPNPYHDYKSELHTVVLCI